MANEVKEGSDTIITSIFRGIEVFLKSLLCDMKGSNQLESAQKDLEGTLYDYLKTKKEKEEGNNGG